MDEPLNHADAATAVFDCIYKKKAHLVAATGRKAHLAAFAGRDVYLIAYREWCEAFVRAWLACSPEQRAAQLRQERKLTWRWLSRAATAANKAEEDGTIAARMRANAIRRRAQGHVERFQLLEAASHHQRQDAQASPAI